MILAERLKEIGMTEADVELVESQINEKAEELAESKAEKLVEAEMTQINESIQETVAKFDEQFKGYAEVVAESVEAKYKDEFEAEVNRVVESFKEKFNDYSAYIIQEAQAKTQTQSDLKVSMAEELMEAVAGVFGEYNLALPEQGNFEEEIAEQIESLEESQAELQEENSKLRKQIIESEKASIRESVSADLTVMQTESFNELAESIFFTDNEMYKARLVKLAESISGTKQEDITESEDIITESEDEAGKPDMSKYVQAIKAYRR